MVGAHRAEEVRCGLDTVGLLDTQFGGVADDGAAAGARGGDGEDGDLVDEVGNERASDLDAVEPARGLDAEVRQRLAGAVALVRGCVMGAPIAWSTSMSAVRLGFRPTP